MATFTQLVKISQDSNFQQRIKVGLLQTAVAVYNELNTVTGHTVRASYATKVLSNQNFDLPTIALAVLGTSTIATEAAIQTIPDYAILDTDISSAFSSIWNALAGV